MKKGLNKGFTLIELLVVIAIIGILSGIVLTSLNNARSKATDAKAKTQLANMRAQAEIYYDGHTQSYTGLCAATAANSGLAELLAATPGAGCADADTAWAAAAPIVTTGTWCVDSTGFSGTTTRTISAGVLSATSCR